MSQKQNILPTLIDSSGCRLLIGHKKSFVLLCPIGEQFLLSSFRELVHDSYCLATFTKLVRARETFIFNFPNQKRRNYRWVEKTFGMLSAGAIQFAPTQGLFRLYLKTFVPPFLPTRLTALGLRGCLLGCFTEVQWNPAQRPLNVYGQPYLYRTVSFVTKKAHTCSLKLIRLIRTPVNTDNGHFSMSRVTNSHVSSISARFLWMNIIPAKT